MRPPTAIATERRDASADDTGDSAGATQRALETDQDIVHLGTHGDVSTAIELLVFRYGTPVYKYCYKQLKNNALADDVRQQVFIEAYRDLPRFQARSSVRTWLFAIARHRVLDAIKSRRRARRHVTVNADMAVFDPNATPDAMLDDARLRQALVDSLAEVSPAVREVVLLRYQQGFTFEEMAEVLREQPNTLQIRLYRALPVLRRNIEARLGHHSHSREH